VDSADGEYIERVWDALPALFAVAVFRISIGSCERVLLFAIFLADAVYPAYDSGKRWRQTAALFAPSLNACCRA